jgi:hypothetical protein
MEKLLATAGWAEDPTSLDPGSILLTLLLVLGLPMVPVGLWFFFYKGMLDRGRVTFASLVAFVAACVGAIVIFVCVARLLPR